ncbi:MAG: hypothetical protein HUJ57_08520 [Erysipelotrichaceae bacterium]|nr:hypothetical protein [Erysipelotrichaceae bacterium]
MTEYNSSLSTKRIVISLILFFGIPALTFALKMLGGNETLAFTAACNVLVTALIIYDWNLFGIHYNRFKERFGESFMFYVLALIIISGWTWINVTFLKGDMKMPDPAVIRKYQVGAPLIMMAYSYMRCVGMGLACKCMTDRLKVQSQELQVILVSGFLFAALYVVAFIPFNIIVWTLSFLYYVVTYCVISYTYNQCHSFLPGYLALGTVQLVLIILSIM